MIAAIYAPKSTDQSDVADDQKSVARQIERGRAYAAARGWIVAEAHVYIDDGISGAEFTNRPGYMRLLNALKPRALLQVLIVSELSRLGREQLETGYAVKQLAQAGVTIHSYLENREVRLDTPVEKFLMSAVNFASELTKAIAAAGPLESLVAELQVRERRRAELNATTAASLAINVEHLDRARIEKRVHMHLAHWRALLTRHVQDGRQVLREVLTGPIRFTPEGRTYRFEGEGRVRPRRGWNGRLTNQCGSGTGNRTPI